MKIWKYIKFALWGYWRIPKGDYCYKMLEVVYPEITDLPPTLRIRRCPYWDRVDGMHHQEDGYCHWMECGDAPETDEDGEVIGGWGLLWDQVKECGLRNYSEKEEQKMYEECMRNRE
jgi:hypothetical protein